MFYNSQLTFDFRYIIFIISEHSNDLNSYEISTVVDGEITGSINVEYENEFVINRPLNKAGYIFDGWYFNENEIEYRYTDEEGNGLFLWGKTEDVSVYAKWIYEEYNIIYLLNGGINNENNPEKVNIESYVNLYHPTKEGYRFLGWYIYNTTTNTYYDIPISFISSTYIRNVVSDINLYTKWSANAYLVNLDVNGGDPLQTNTLELVYDCSDYSIDIIPIRTGYSFQGWFDGSGIQYTDNIGQSIHIWDKADDSTLYAHWEIIEYSITYILNEGINNENNPLTYTVENGIIELCQPSKENYIFIGWKDNQGYYISTINTANLHCDVVLQAEWSITNEN